MLRISRFGLSLLLLNLSLVGQDLVCAHEAQALEQPAGAAHEGSGSHHQSLPPTSQQSPCDESSSQCCDAIASCAISGVPERASHDTMRPDLQLGRIAGIELHLSSAPLEVATPPPRG